METDQDDLNLDNYDDAEFDDPTEKTELEDKVDEAIPQSKMSNPIDSINQRLSSNNKLSSNGLNDVVSNGHPQNVLKSNSFISDKPKSPPMPELPDISSMFKIDLSNLQNLMGTFHSKIQDQSKKLGQLSSTVKKGSDKNNELEAKFLSELEKKTRDTSESIDKLKSEYSTKLKTSINQVSEKNENKLAKTQDKVKTLEEKLKDIRRHIEGSQYESSEDEARDLSVEPSPLKEEEPTGSNPNSRPGSQQLEPPSPSKKRMLKSSSKNLDFSSDSFKEAFIKMFEEHVLEGESFQQKVIEIAGSRPAQDPAQAAEAPAPASNPPQAPPEEPAQDVQQPEEVKSAQEAQDDEGAKPEEQPTQEIKILTEPEEKEKLASGEGERKTTEGEAKTKESLPAAEQIQIQIEESKSEDHEPASAGLKLESRDSLDQNNAHKTMDNSPALKERNLDIANLAPKDNSDHTRDRGLVMRKNSSLSVSPLQSGKNFARQSRATSFKHALAGMEAKYSPFIVDTNLVPLIRFTQPPRHDGEGSPVASKEDSLEEFNSFAQIKDLLESYAQHMFEFSRDIEKNVKQLQISVVHSEGVEMKVNRTIVQLEKRIKMIQEDVEKGAGLASLDLQNLAGGNMDAAALVDALQGVKKDLQKKFVSQGEFEEKYDEVLSKLNSNFAKKDLVEMFEAQDKKIADIKQDLKTFEFSLEDVSDRQVKQRRQIDAKLDAVYFDEELDEMKQLITMLSEMSSDQTSTQIQQQIQQSKKKRREDGAGVKMSDKQRQELDNIIAEFPGLVSRTKSLQKMVDGLNPKDINERLKEATSGKIGRNELQSMEDMIKHIEQKVGSFSGQMKKISHAQQLQEDDHQALLIKLDHRHADLTALQMESSKKIEWLENITHGMKKRMSDFQQNMAELTNRVNVQLMKKMPKGPDPAEERARKEQLENHEERLNNLKSEMEKYRTTTDVEISKLGSKVEIQTVEDLEAKMESKFKSIHKDLKYKEKKLERIARANSNENSDGLHQNSSKKSLNGRRKSVDFSQTVVAKALMPKLPFIKEGDRISKFGHGYSRILKNSPQSPTSLNNQMMPASGLMSPLNPGAPIQAFNPSGRGTEAMPSNQNNSMQPSVMAHIDHNSPVSQQQQVNMARIGTPPEVPFPGQSYATRQAPPNAQDQSFDMFQMGSRKNSVKTKLRYHPTMENKLKKNQLKMRKEFILMQQDYQNQQMSSALATIRLQNTFDQRGGSLGHVPSTRTLKKQILEDGDSTSLQQVPSHGFLPEITKQSASPMMTTDQQQQIANLQQQHLIAMAQALNLGSITQQDLKYLQQPQQQQQLQQQQSSSALTVAASQQQLQGMPSPTQSNNQPFPQQTYVGQPVIANSPVQYHSVFPDNNGQVSMLNVAITGQRKLLNRKKADKKTEGESSLKLNNPNDHSNSNSVAKKPVFNVLPTQEGSEELTNDMHPSHLDVARMQAPQGSTMKHRHKSKNMSPSPSAPDIRKAQKPPEEQEISHSGNIVIKSQSAKRASVIRSGQMAAGSNGSKQSNQDLDGVIGQQEKEQMLPRSQVQSLAQSRESVLKKSTKNDKGISAQTPLEEATAAAENK